MSRPLGPITPAALAERAPTEADVRNDLTGVVLAAACKSSERFQIAFHKLHDELVVAGVTPAIAVNAADQHLTIVIDFHQWAVAVGADLIAHFETSLRAIRLIHCETSQPFTFGTVECVGFRCLHYF